jgi:hypothetical protein
VIAALLTGPSECFNAPTGLGQNKVRERNMEDTNALPPMQEPDSNDEIAQYLNSDQSIDAEPEDSGGITDEAQDGGAVNSPPEDDK